jgi:hypothetical protein
LHRSVRGERIEPEWVYLIEVTRRVSTLVETPLPPPHGFAPGRQRLLVEAARRRAARRGNRGAPIRMARPMRLAGALVAVVLVLGMILGVGQAAADSLPGQVLYGTKLGAERVRLGLTTRPASRVELAVDLVEQRLDEITTMMEMDQAIDDDTVARLQKQLALAIHATAEAGDKAPAWSHQRLMATIQKHQRDMDSAISSLPEVDQTPVRQLLRSMAQARQELHLGQGTPAADGARMRQGTPPDAADMPDPSEDQPGPGADPQDSPGPGVRNPASQPGPGPGTSEVPDELSPADRPGRAPGAQKADSPAGSEPAAEPGAGPGPQPVDRPAEPEIEPSQEPGDAEPQPTPMPTPVPTPMPMDPGPTDPQAPGEANPGPGQPPGNDNGSGRNGRP